MRIVGDGLAQQSVKNTERLWTQESGEAGGNGWPGEVRLVNGAAACG